MRKFGASDRNPTCFESMSPISGSRLLRLKL